MSCKNPLFITNNKFRNFNSLTLATHTPVPCGKCSGCLVDKRDELSNLIQTEQLANLLNGGYCAFLTFTYSDSNLPNMLFKRDYHNHYKIDPSYNLPCVEVVKRVPYIVVNSYRGKTLRNTRYSCSVPYADYRDVQNFFKVIRKTLSRLNPDFELRYVFASEYGTDPRYTRRPHFHALLFLNKPLGRYFGAHHGSKSFMSFCKKYWKRGIVAESSNGIWVDGTCGTPAYYLSKYVVKGNDVSQHPHFKRFYSFYKSNKTAFTNYFTEYFYSLGTIEHPTSFDVDFIFRFFHLKNKIRKSLRFGHAQLPFIEKFLSSEKIEDLAPQFQLSPLFDPIPFSKNLIKFVINHAETEKKNSYFVNALRNSVNHIVNLLRGYYIYGQPIRRLDIACYLLFYNRSVFRLNEHRLDYSSYNNFLNSLRDVLHFETVPLSLDFSVAPLSDYEPYYDVLPYDITCFIEELDNIITYLLPKHKRDDTFYYLHLLK